MKTGRKNGNGKIGFVETIDHIQGIVDDDDDVYLIEILQHVGYEIYLLRDQPGRHKYKMNSNQQIIVIWVHIYVHI
jgi:hypothetical protein